MKMKMYFKFTIALSFLVFLSTCNKEGLSPFVSLETTNENVEITYTSIKISGIATSSARADITSRGICWSTSPEPTIDDNKFEATDNVFTSVINELNPNTTYYFRTYATNEDGTAYSRGKSFRTLSLANRIWRFHVVYSETVSWYADVQFNANGTTVYDEPDNPGFFLTLGTWEFIGDVLHYDLDSSNDDNTFLQLTGTFTENNELEGVISYGSEDKPWTATEEQSMIESLKGTTWDFYVNIATNPVYGSWNADVTFYADGTTFYTEPCCGDTYDAYGTWIVDDNNVLTFDLDATDTVWGASSIWTGRLLKSNNMTGTWELAVTEFWTATKY